MNEIGLDCFFTPTDKEVFELGLKSFSYNDEQRGSYATGYAMDTKQGKCLDDY